MNTEKMCVDLLICVGRREPMNIDVNVGAQKVIRLHGCVQYIDTEKTPGNNATSHKHIVPVQAAEQAICERQKDSRKLAKLGWISIVSRALVVEGLAAG